MASLTNAGPLTVDSLYVGHGSTVNLVGGGSISSLLSLTDGSCLTVQRTGGTGLSITDASPGLSIDSTSVMHLIFNEHGAGELGLPLGGPVERQLDLYPQGLISSGEITISTPLGFTCMPSSIWAASPTSRASPPRCPSPLRSPWRASASGVSRRGPGGVATGRIPPEYASPSFKRKNGPGRPRHGQAARMSLKKPKPSPLTIDRPVCIKTAWDARRPPPTPVAASSSTADRLFYAEGVRAVGIDRIIADRASPR